MLELGKRLAFCISTVVLIGNIGCSQPTSNVAPPNASTSTDAYKAQADQQSAMAREMQQRMQQRANPRPAGSPLPKAPQ